MSIVYVIGIGFRPLNRIASDVMLRSSAIFASPRLMEVFPGYVEYNSVKDRIVILDSVDATIEAIKGELDKCDAAEFVLLASGDPVFFGIGSRAVEEFGSHRVKIMPDMTSMQNAFSRINESWDNAFFISLHGGPYPGRRRRLRYTLSDIPVLLEKNSKIGILTDRQNNPQAIAEHIRKNMSSEKYKKLTMCIFEKLGYAEEKITIEGIDYAARSEFSNPNIVILLNPEASGPVCFSDQIKYGFTGKEIEHADSFALTDEARAVVLHKLRLPNSGIMYDIGAGIGDLSVEAAGISPGIKIYAVEKKTENAAICRKNRARFDAFSIEVVEGEAPQCLAQLPEPDRVFIGCRMSDSIIDFICGRSSPIFVINADSQDSAVQAAAVLKKNGYRTEIVSLDVSFLNTASGITKSDASDMIFIVRGEPL